MAKCKLHINCDMAESYGNFKIGNDTAIFPFIDAANIACGFHGGDSFTICNTIKKALENKIAIGAHPSYPDLQGFGRRYLELSDEELKCILIYQINVIKAITEMYGGKMQHVKPHGAMYNRAAVDHREANLICEVVFMIDPSLEIYTLPDSILAKVALAKGIAVKNEAFADRRYDEKGRLLSRNLNGSILSSLDEIIDQIKHIQQGMAKTIDGHTIHIKPDTICVHGDHPLVEEVLTSIRTL